MFFLFSIQIQFSATTGNEHCVCTQEYDPVCLYGDTFGNKCMAKCEYPDVDDDEIDAGECPERNPCWCTREYDPFCVNGETFGNWCMVKCEHPHLRKSQATAGECPK